MRITLAQPIDQHSIDDLRLLCRKTVAVIVVPAGWPRRALVPRVARALTFSASARALYSEVESSGVCFERKFLRWHGMCIEKPVLLKAQLPGHDTDLALAGRPEKDH